MPNEDLQQQIDRINNRLNLHLGVQPGGQATVNNPHNSIDTGVFISAARFTIANGTPDLALRGSAAYTSQMPAYALDPASVESLTCSLQSSLSQWTITFFLACPNGNSGNIVMDCNVGIAGLTDQIDATGIALNTQTVASPQVTDQLFSCTFTQNNLQLSNHIVRINVTRTGTSGSDTYASDVWFLGLLLN